MANIRENKKNGKTISYRFTACLERDENGKQIRRYCTWKIPEGLSPSKARKAAERAADKWEQDVKAEYELKRELIQTGEEHTIPLEKRKNDFCSFINDTWFPLQVKSNGRKPKTISFYASMLKIITGYFKGTVLQEISPLDIQKYLSFLRTEYIGKTGKPLTPKSVHHQYNTLNLIFNYAENLDMISNNPMRKVEAPKKQKGAIDASTQEQAKDFFDAISDEPLDFHCMLQLLITTGLRRGECLGLQWKNIDYTNMASIYSLSS